ncbi:MAG TPA: LamG-like jellyroll fold domain-containing protein [Terriglobales bacterium]|nr:LamG-like jellyroll fold domain-containing protein [Terriglobales bacterium]
MVPPPPDRLDSWKEIAAYLDRQVRTVQRWEKEEGLPIHRHAHRRQGSVYAFVTELDAWRENRRALVAAPDPPAAPARSFSRKPILAFFALALLAAGGYLLLHKRPPAPPPSFPAPAGRWFASATSEGASPRLIAVSPHPDLVAQSRDGATLAVSDDKTNSIAILDASTLGRAANIPLPAPVAGLAFARDGQSLFAALQGTSQVEVVAIRSGAVRLLPVPGVITDLVASADGSRLYLAMPFAGLAWMDATTAEIHRLATPACPDHLALARDGKHLYVAYQCGGLGGSRGHDAIGILDLSSNTLVGSLVGPRQIGAALGLSPDGGQIWSSLGDVCTAPQYSHQGCFAGEADGLNIFNLATAKLIRTVPLPAGQAVHYIAFLADNSRAVISGGAISVVDATRASVLERFPATDARGIAVSPDQRRLFVALGARHALAVFDASQPACAPPVADLAGWWPGDGSADDGWGLNHGMLERGAGFVPGRLGQALHAFGYAQIRVLHDQSLLVKSGFALALWLRLQPVPTSTPLIAKASGADGWQLVERNDGRVELRVGKTVLAAPRILLGGWHHVAFSLSGHSNSTLYVDGVAAARGRLDLRRLSAPQADLILSHGDFDEVAYYTGGISAATVRALARMPACVGPQ